MFVIYSIIAYLIGCQCRLVDLRLMNGNVNFQKQMAQIISYITILFVFILFIYESITHSLTILFFTLFIALFVSFVSEFFWSKVNTRSRYYTVVFRAAIIVLFAAFMDYWGEIYYSSLSIMGLYASNCVLGIVHGKDMQISAHIRRKINFTKSNQLEEIDFSMLPDFSHAGNKKQINDKLPVFNVLDFGIKPNTAIDYTSKVNELINNIGAKGGGRLFFPRGRYYFNKNKDKKAFLSINYSNIILEGELNDDGNPLSELICCNHTLKGEKNPWLSPFFITTGEVIQPSNWFWGLQFRKKKNLFTKSVSRSDPGSDGSILSPEIFTKVISDSKQGSDLLNVDDSSIFDRYALLGMYNTSKDGPLIKDILGINIRPEWKTPMRAGEEEAPSFQWLVEIKEIIDKHTIRLCQPLWRDCLAVYEPELYPVKMLENVCIRNLKLTSSWNGLFRHHGLYPYYSINQTQEMDYGWNAINMKRVAHGNVENVEIRNFTNPLYIVDSRNLTISSIKICGYDGHQGIKLYEHACDNLISNVDFYCHFADMMGGEGNAYGNVFSSVRYMNPQFNPCDYDFHGFSEGPMSPPAYNLFENIYGFRYIKMGGAIYNQPACAQWNVWWNCVSEGETDGDYILCSLHYNKSVSLSQKVKCVIRSFSKLIPIQIYKDYNRRIDQLKETCMHPQDVSLLYKNVWLLGYKSKFVAQNNDNVHTINPNKTCAPYSLFNNR